ncbi:MAG: hypothetical protein NTW08_10305 [Gammaproteobacteria bacterium]|nr:hypothetical protein [Gammaproteobacteria bacterium]
MKHPLLTVLRHAAQPYTVTLTDRLPSHVLSPCVLTCVWQTEQSVGPMLLTLTLSGSLTLQCQRCLDEFCFPYHHTLHLAICKRERDLKESADLYEYVLLAEIDSLPDLITDELYFSTPDRHLDEGACSSVL